MIGIALCFLVLMTFLLIRAFSTAEPKWTARDDGFWLKPGLTRRGESIHLRWRDSKDVWHDETLVYHPGPMGQFISTQCRPVSLLFVSALKPETPQWQLHSSSSSSSSESSFSSRDDFPSSDHPHHSSSSSSETAVISAAAWESSLQAPLIDAQSISDSPLPSSSDSTYPSAY
jgi:hypothetical protein